MIDIYKSITNLNKKNLIGENYENLSHENHYKRN